MRKGDEVIVLDVSRKLESQVEEILEYLDSDKFVDNMPDLSLTIVMVHVLLEKIWHDMKMRERFCERR